MGKKITQPTVNQYKVIYTKSCFVNGIERDPGEVFVERDSFEMRKLISEGFLQLLGEADD